MQLTDREKHVLLHTLGYDYKPKPFRNRYVIGTTNDGYHVLEGLVEKGLMIKNPAPFNADQYCYQATHDGQVEAAIIYRLNRRSRKKVPA